MKADLPMQAGPTTCVLPIPPDCVEPLRAVLLQQVARHPDPPRNARLIVETLPALLLGARLSITCAVEYRAPAAGGLTFASVTADLGAEASFTAAETYSFPQSGSESSSSMIFECRPDGFAKGDLGEWLVAADAMHGGKVTIYTDASNIVAAGSYRQQAAGCDPDPSDEVDWADDDCGKLDRNAPSLDAQRWELLPTAVERAQDDARGVSKVLETVVNRVVIARDRLRGDADTPLAIATLFAILSALAGLLGKSPGWMVPAAIAVIAATLGVAKQVSVGGVDRAILELELTLRQHGVSIKWEPKGGKVRAEVRWKQLEAMLMAAVSVSPTKTLQHKSTEATACDGSNDQLRC